MAANPELEFVEPDTQETPSEEYREEQLLAAIDERFQTAIGSDSDQLANDRATAIDYYLGAPFGNEIEGRSQVVSKDTFDTIEWMKPSLLRIFAGGEKVCEFQPQGEEDVEAAAQESDYVDYILQRKNNWFMTAYEWFTDALLTKNAYVFGYWESKEEPSIERYQGLTDDQLALIGMDQTVEITAHKAYPAQIPMPMQGPQMQPMALAVQQSQVMLHDVDLRRRKTYGCVKIECLPPERCLVARDAKGMSVKHADYFEFWEFKTISQLRIEGFNVPDDVEDTGGTDRGIVDQTRDLTTTTILTEQQEVTDPSMRKVRARNIWIRNDFDGDGIAELRQIVRVGDHLLVNQEVSSIPVACIVPYPMPHRHVGLSLHDAVMDMQQIRSMLLRAAIDNQFQANNTRTAVDKNTVNLDDMLQNAPGSTVRVDGPPAQSIMPFAHANTVAGTLEMLNYTDMIRQDRGGVSKPVAGGDLNAIMAQPGTVAQLVSAASQKIELIARIFAEGVKELFLIVHELTLTNATVADKVELRGKWVNVDPREWKKRSDMTLSVGLGTGNRQQHVAAIAALLGIQEKSVQAGLTTRKRIYNGLNEYVKGLGFASAQQFFIEPTDQAADQPMQPGQPYQLQVAQIQAQANVLIQQMKQSGESAMQSIKEEGSNIRSYFETMVAAQNDAMERHVRTLSEITDRMHELRLEKDKSAA